MKLIKNGAGKFWRLFKMSILNLTMNSDNKKSMKVFLTVLLFGTYV